MRKGLGARPRHSEHHVDWYSESLSAVNVCEARRIRNDGVCDKRLRTYGIGLDTGAPASIKHLGNHFALPLDIASPKALHAGNQSRIPHHIGHQLRRIATDGVECKTGIPDKLIEGIVRGQPDIMTVLLQLRSQSDEWLDISTTSDHLDHDVELDGKYFAAVLACRVRRRRGLVEGLGNRRFVWGEGRESLNHARVDVDGQTAIVYAQIVSVLNFSKL